MPRPTGGKRRVDDRHCRRGRARRQLQAGDDIAIGAVGFVALFGKRATSDRTRSQALNSVPIAPGVAGSAPSRILPSRFSAA